ncbi:uncharacterized protein BJ212DRAFT_1585797 [Suillus subaureus]|uniref:Uncharacterized protein n=1 Tax=Suillus subaureus TaxID=48587 RepID=A0A9P7EIF8_9AGAM|nr:uncharacterized protein BJ212DRAFT_1585797 [Suillus subaureus]KAG1821867.1 hypothetical protein BJ212DRAFT_1585797 [Suillus subaureus]
MEGSPFQKVFGASRVDAKLQTVMLDVPKSTRCSETADAPSAAITLGVHLSPRCLVTAHRTRDSGACQSRECDPMEDITSYSRIFSHTKIYSGASEFHCNSLINAKVGSQSDARVALEGHRFTISKALRAVIADRLATSTGTSIGKETEKTLREAMYNKVKTLASRSDLNALNVHTNLG